MRLFARYLSVSLLLASIPVASVGCQSRAAGDPEQILRSVVPVSGQVRYSDGRPVANAWVVFHPKDPPGNEAAAPTGPDGTFRLSTFGKEDGAVPGRYVVTVEPNPTAKKPASGLPRKYQLHTTSSLTVVVSETGPMTLPPFDLK